eukprot:11994724-Heterocapsa_arctica.AAC.1
MCSCSFFASAASKASSSLSSKTRGFCFLTFSAVLLVPERAALAHECARCRDGERGRSGVLSPPETI